jgi:energy-coupling factor transport system ATP-binding protein
MRPRRRCRRSISISRPASSSCSWAPEKGGKTTSAKCLNCSIPQFQPGRLSGSIRVLDRALEGATVSDLAGMVGLVSQDFEAQLFATNVRQEVAFGLGSSACRATRCSGAHRTALEFVGLASFGARDPGMLSGGEKQRLAIAALLALEPALLVFDEPTTDLDPLGKAAVFDVLAALRGRGGTTLLIEHETEAAQRADRLLLMEEGRIVADGDPRILLRDVERLERLGVRPLDLDRLADRLGWPEHVASVEQALAQLEREQGQRGGLIVAASAADVAAPASGPPLLSVEHVDFSYREGAHALDDVSLTIQAGEFLAVIGQNGSGKTTLAKCLNGLLRPQRGAVRLRGTDLAGLPLNRLATDIGYVFQNPDHQIFAASVREEVEFALRNFASRRMPSRSACVPRLRRSGWRESRRSIPFCSARGSASSSRWRRFSPSSRRC